MISTSHYDQQGKSNGRAGKQLPEKAVRLMNAWYAAHEDDPYPNRNDLDYLATHGEIKESQVKAWFSNKRNRTQNTHPKRAQRYLLRNQTEPQKIQVADELEQRAFQVQPCYSNPHFPRTYWPCLPNNSSNYYQYD